MASIVSQDAQGRPIIRAIHVSDGLQVDGQLEEPLYRDVTPVSEFYLMEPNPGEPATERTEVWVAYDAEYVYVSMRCWDSQPEARWVVDAQDTSTKTGYFWIGRFTSLGS